MADTTFRTVLPDLKAIDNGDGTYSLAVSIRAMAADLDMGGYDIVDAGDIYLGANNLKTTTLLLYEITTDALAIRDHAKSLYLKLRVGDLWCGRDSTAQGIYFMYDAQIIRGPTADNFYYDLMARDVDGAAYVSAIRIQNANDIEIGFFAATPVSQRLKANYNNWAAFGDVVDALVALGLFDQA